MTVTTHVQTALESVERDRAQLADRIEAVDGFARGVDAIRPVSPIEPTMTAATGGGTLAASAAGSPSASPDRCREVRELFASTIGAARDEAGRSAPLRDQLSDEFGRELALVLSSERDRQFTPDVKAALLSAVRSRRADLYAVDTALATEADSLRSAAETVETVTDWLVRTDETPLSELGFDELRDRHETLSRHRERCRRVLRDRQAVLHDATAPADAARIPHQRLVASLYSDCAVSYPVLATLCRLEGCCADCQRTVRDHLVRRV